MAARLHPLLLGLLPALLAPAAHAEDVYRWVDAQGRTHYGSAPPPGVPATRVGPPAAPSAGAASAAREQARRTIDQAAREAAERDRARAEGQQRDAAAQRDGAGRLARCAQARQQFDVVSRGGPVFRVDERGQRIDLPDAQRDAEIARLRAEVAASCQPQDPAQGAAARQRAAEAERETRCAIARATVADLEAAGPRIPGWELEQARQRARALCGPAAH